MNSFTISGRVVQDLNLKTTHDGKKYVKFRVAVDRPHKKDVTDFFTVAVWGQSAEFMCNNAIKGTVICATGCMTVNKWQTQDGQDRVDHELQAENCEIIFSTKVKQKVSNASSAPLAPLEVPVEVSEPLADEDLPFLL